MGGGDQSAGIAWGGNTREHKGQRLVEKDGSGLRSVLGTLKFRQLFVIIVLILKVLVGCKNKLNK